MKIVYSFLKLNNSEKIILFKALFLLWIVRIMLWIFPFPIIQKIINKFTLIPEENKLHKIYMEKLIWTIEVMSIYTPNATCLTRALAANILLARYNYPSNIKIGVSKNEGEFEAHAWLEADDRIILGESDTEYIHLLNLGEKTQ